MTNFLSDYPSRFDSKVEKLTTKSWVAEDFFKIQKLCDQLEFSLDCKDCLKSIIKRLNSDDPKIVSLAISLLDVCSGQCNKEFKLQVASQEFVTEFCRLLDNNRFAQPELYEKLMYLLKRWAEGDYKSDRHLATIPLLYDELKAKGYNFSYKCEKMYPWSFQLQYPVALLSYEHVKNEAERVLYEIQDGNFSERILMPLNLEWLQERLHCLNNEIDHGFYEPYNDFEVMLTIRKDISDLINQIECEMKKS